jgi:hypothetical protein
MLDKDMFTKGVVANSNCCKVWTFENAPLKYQRLSEYGSDGDLVIFAANGSDFSQIVERLNVYVKEQCEVDDGTIIITTSGH